MSFPSRFLQLGTLEETIMNVVWRDGRVSVRQVVDLINRRRRVAYTTVMPVMYRLCKKNILKRSRDKSGAYVYQAIQNKQDFLREISKKMIQNLVREYGEVAIAQFINVVGASNRKELAEWKRKLQKLK